MGLGRSGEARGGVAACKAPLIWWRSTAPAIAPRSGPTALGQTDKPQSISNRVASLWWLEANFSFGIEIRYFQSHGRRSTSTRGAGTWTGSQWDNFKAEG